MSPCSRRFLTRSPSGVKRVKRGGPERMDLGEGSAPIRSAMTFKGTDSDPPLDADAIRRDRTVAVGLADLDGPQERANDMALSVQLQFGPTLSEVLGQLAWTLVRMIHRSAWPISRMASFSRLSSTSRQTYTWDCGIE